MTHPGGIEYRRGVAADALCLGVLATQVFLDTYATAGIRADLAREVLAGYSPEFFALRLDQPSVRFMLAMQGDAMVGFAELESGRPCPAQADATVELVRLYVQRPFQRHGIGLELLDHAERQALGAGSGALWLSAWCGNGSALAFYSAAGYADIGTMNHVIEGQAYENRVLLKSLPNSRAT